MLYVSFRMQTIMFADHAIATKKETNKGGATALVNFHLKEDGNVRFDSFGMAGYEDALNLTVPVELEIKEIDLVAGDYLLVITCTNLDKGADYFYDCWAIS